MGRDTQNLASPNMVERWRAARRVGEAIPSYEAVVLGNLGRFADQAAVVTTEGGQPGRILWGGERFIAWLGCGIRSGLSVATLSEDRSCPSMRWKFGVELERPSVRRPEVELL